jgi:hypothetical protein
MYDRLKRAKAKRVAAGAEAPPTVSQMREAGAEVLDLLAAQATVVVLSGPAVEGSR